MAGSYISDKAGGLASIFYRYYDVGAMRSSAGLHYLIGSKGQNSIGPPPPPPPSTVVFIRAQLVVLLRSAEALLLHFFQPPVFSAICALIMYCRCC